MSVPQSERRQSDHEYIVILQQIEEFFIDNNESEKSRVPLLSEHLVQLSMEAYDSATMYFELCNGKVKGTLAQKKKYCKKTIYTARQLASQINILVAYRMGRNQKVKGMLLKTKDLLKVCDLLQSQLTKLNRTTEEDKE